MTARAATERVHHLLIGHSTVSKAVLKLLLIAKKWCIGGERRGVSGSSWGSCAGVQARARAPKAPTQGRKFCTISRTEGIGSAKGPLRERAD